MRNEEIVYICNRPKCGSRFSLDESGTFNDNGELIAICPDCGSSDIEEGRRCPVCREIVRENDMEGIVCKKCFADAQQSLKVALGYLQPWEREALDWIYGNIDVTEE